jgi:esterase/lipase superfamily enzyme
MEKHFDNWYSDALQKDMPLVRYGNNGFALLMIPTAGADFLEYERFGLIDYLVPFTDSGKMQIFSINTVNNESWLNNNMLPEHKAIRHNQFNVYVFNEVIPYIKSKTPEHTPVIACGASLGAYHSMNLFLKKPDLINGAICMSGVYELAEYTKGYWDEQVYFNSPMQYMPNLTDSYFLDKIRASNHIHIYTGSGSHEDPEANKRFSEVLSSKSISHDLSIWGQEINHDWPTWRAMLPHILSSKF